jgi:hypothetical protein
MALRISKLEQYDFCVYVFLENTKNIMTNESRIIEAIIVDALFAIRYK